MIDLNTGLFTVENNARTQINEVGGIASGDTTFTVDDGSKFRVGMICTLSDKEYIQNSTVTERVRITGIASNDLTVTRNIDGIGAQTFVDNAWIQGANYAEPIAQLQNLLTQKLYIVPVVSGGNLTLNVSTTPYDPSNPTVFTSPTPSNPIPVWIGGVLRYITGALSVTVNAGTNWFNSGSSELATREIDYFLYIGFNTSTGNLNIGLSRIPYGRIGSDFSFTSTNEKGILLSEVGFAGTDNVVNIGRFAATLSAGAGHTWTVPVFTNANLIQEPIYETRTLQWQPVYTGSGSLSFGTIVYSNFRYKLIGHSIFYTIAVQGTTSGTASTTIEISTPFEISSHLFSDNVAMSCHVINAGTNTSGQVRFGGASKIRFLLASAGNWNLGANTYLQFIGNLLI